MRALSSSLFPPRAESRPLGPLQRLTPSSRSYAAMVLYHLVTYLKAQDYSPRLQHRLLKWSHALLVFTKLVTWFQKLVPAAFALYWLGKSASLAFSPSSSPPSRAPS